MVRKLAPENGVNSWHWFLERVSWVLHWKDVLWTLNLLQHQFENRKWAHIATHLVPLDHSLYTAPLSVVLCVRTLLHSAYIPIGLSYVWVSLPDTNTALIDWLIDGATVFKNSLRFHHFKSDWNYIRQFYLNHHPIEQIRTQQHTVVTGLLSGVDGPLDADAVGLKMYGLSYFSPATCSRMYCFWA